MTFNSVEFAVFFLAVLALYWTVPGRWRNAIVLAASYVFYGWWDWRFLGLLAVSTVVDFTVGRALGSATVARRRTALLLVSVGVNLGLLAAFKYFNFFADSAREVLGSVGWEADSFTLKVVLPVGISFYTFQTMSYTFDIYRRRIEPTSNIVTFATYVAYFPQLVAGPIERAQRLLPLIADTNRRPPRGEQLADAFRLILVGLAKKVVLADGVAHVANAAFDQPDDMSAIALAAGVVAFAIQIYGDFSGYTDIARGVSRLLGIDLMLNFSEPYLSRNITEFWRRWHISLSNWLRDYLYVPLGGNRGSTLTTYRNLMITMLLGGLWHGPSWNFVIWGGLHGLFLVLHRLIRAGEVSDRAVSISDVPSILITNIAVCLAWVFFRADSFTDAWAVISGIATLQSGVSDAADLALVVAFVAAMIAVDLWQRRGARIEIRSDLDALRVGLGAAGLAVAIVVFSGATPAPFIYFQF